MNINGQKIVVIYSGKYPSEKAHSFFVSKNCESFAKGAANVVLATSKKFSGIKEDSYSYFGIKKNFTIVRLSIVNLFPYSIVSQKIAFYFAQLTFSISCFFYLLFHSGKEDILYSNEILSLFWMLLLRRRVYYEMHDFPEKKLFFYKIFFSRISGVVVTNKWKRKKLKEKFNLPSSKLLYVPNAVDIKKFNIKILRNDARAKLKLPKDKKIISYIGKYKTMGMEKGVGDIVKAFAKIMQEKSDIFFMIVGVNKNEFNEVDKLFKDLNISNSSYKIFLHVPQNEIVYYMKSSDALVMNYPNSDHYAYYMSPMKMFEYMASGRPIVATNLPSITEILNSENAILVEPNNLKSLINGIITVLDDEILAGKLLKKALEDAQNFTWEKRADKILKFIKN